jgi:hypothetical protein
LIAALGHAAVLRVLRQRARGLGCAVDRRRPRVGFSERCWIASEDRLQNREQPFEVGLVVVEMRRRPQPIAPYADVDPLFGQALGQALRWAGKKLQAKIMSGAQAPRYRAKTKPGGALGNRCGVRGKRRRDPIDAPGEQLLQTGEAIRYERKVGALADVEAARPAGNGPGNRSGGRSLATGAHDPVLLDGATILMGGRHVEVAEAVRPKQPL